MTIARSLTWSVLGQVAALAVGFFTSVATARILGPSDRGLLGVLAAAMTVTVVLGALGLPIAIGYFSSKEHAPDAALLGNALLWAAMIGVPLVTLVGFGGGHWLAATFSAGRGSGLWVWTSALVPLTFLDWSFGNHLQGRLEFARYNSVFAVSRVSLLVGTVVLAGVLGLRVTGCIAAMVAAEGVMIGGALTSRFLHIRPRVDLSLFRRTASYGIKVQAGATFQLLNYRLDVLVLQFFRPLRDVGYYVVAQLVAELILTLSRAFQSTLLPYVARASEDVTRSTTSASMLRHHSLLSVVVSLANLLAGPLVIYYGFGRAFGAAIPPFFVLVPAMLFLGAGTVASSDLRGRDKPGSSSALAGAAVLFTVILDLTLIPPLGMMGAAIASAVAYTLYGVGSIWMLARITGLPWRALLLPTAADARAYSSAASRYLRTQRSRGRRSRGTH